MHRNIKGMWAVMLTRHKVNFGQHSKFGNLNVPV